MDEVTAIVGSPPYEQSHGGGGDQLALVPRAVRKTYTTGQPAGEYGANTAGQLGADAGDTFWSAAKIIVQQCHTILKPQGACVWVCKDFVRAGKRVPFSANWARLCESCGFTLTRWCKASLMAEERTADLFGGETVKRTKRVSFFKRLAEAKGSPPIDEEDVLWFVKQGGDWQVEAVVGSPPFCECGTGANKEAHNRQVITGKTATHRMGTIIGKTDYADSSPGQLGAMPEGKCDAVVGSPPFSPLGSQPTGRGQGVHSDYKAGKMKESSSTTDYGGSDGQLATLPMDDRGEPWNGEYDTWTGCYNEGWQGLIVPEAFSHPAKMARGLVRRIFDELNLPKGSTVCDPFGGIGTTGIEGASRGLKVICIELEPKFVELARQNFELHRAAWETLGYPLPEIRQGDSRGLSRVLCEVRR